MNNKDLVTIEKQLRNLNPLEDWSYKCDAESAVSGSRETTSDGRFWFVKRGCVYNIRSGMLPGSASSIHVREVDRMEIAKYSRNIRKIAAMTVFKVLGIPSRDFAELDFTAREHSGTDFHISHDWLVVAQSVWSSVILEDNLEHSNLSVNLFTMSRFVV